MNIKKEIKSGMKIVGDISHFSFAELTSELSGKTSMSRCVAGIYAVCAMIGFIYGTFNKNMELVSSSIMLASISAGLLGVNKWITGKTPIDSIETNTTTSPDPVKIDPPVNAETPDTSTKEDEKPDA
jgi:hypothetical protein